MTFENQIVIREIDNSKKNNSKKIILKKNNVSKVSGKEGHHESTCD